MNHRHGDNYVSILYSTLNLSKALFCPLSPVIISEGFTRDERMSCLLQLLSWALCHSWCQPSESTIGERLTPLFLLQPMSRSSISVGFLCCHFMVNSLRLSCKRIYCLRLFIDYTDLRWEFQIKWYKKINGKFCNNFFPLKRCSPFSDKHHKLWVMEEWMNEWMNKATNE